jgi:hypothetical protein
MAETITNGTITVTVPPELENDRAKVGAWFDAQLASPAPAAAPARPSTPSAATPEPAS